MLHLRAGSEFEGFFLQVARQAFDSRPEMEESRAAESRGRQEQEKTKGMRAEVGREKRRR